MLMTDFIHEDFMLKTATARRLFHGYARALPIIDFHNHLDARMLLENQAFENITQLWITCDQYKHRAMRTVGVPERLIRGEALDREKFQAWAETLPRTMGNPLYHWSALELRRYFGIRELLTPESAPRIWDTCNAQLRELQPRKLLEMANVECMWTSDAPGFDLTAHAELRASGFSVRVLPSLRDATQDGQSRLDAFERLGCCLSDHAVDDFSQLDAIGPLAREYARRGWVMQLHMGAQRNTSSRLRALAGPAGGYASIGSACDIPRLVRFLDDLDRDDVLPRTIFYPLNPVDYAAIATLTGSFPGKLQFGPAWWFNDHALGIRQHLETLAHYGLLSTFVGMVTDSRSLLSMSRHEYFRRILCDFIGDQVEAGLLPADEVKLGELVCAIAYENPKRWLASGKEM